MSLPISGIPSGAACARGRGARPIRARNAGLLALLGLGCFLACRPGRPTGVPADAVQRYYAATASGDCAAALGALGSKLRARLDSGDRCALLFRQTNEHPLERVLGTQVDGRDPAAQLVRVRLRGRVIDLIIRVQAEDGQWKIVSM